MCVSSTRGSQEGIRSPRTGVIDSCEPPLWVLGIEPECSVRVSSALNHWAIPVVPIHTHFKISWKFPHLPLLWHFPVMLLLSVIILSILGGGTIQFQLLFIVDVSSKWECCVEKMLQGVNCLCYRSEDLHLDPQDLRTSHMWWHASVIPVFLQWDGSGAENSHTHTGSTPAYI